MITNEENKLDNLISEENFFPQPLSKLHFLKMNRSVIGKSHKKFLFAKDFIWSILFGVFRFYGVSEVKYLDWNILIIWNILFPS